MCPKVRDASPPFASFFDTFPQGMFLKDPCALLASILVPFASLLAPFGSLLDPFGSLLALFGLLLVPKSLKELFGKHFQKSTLNKYQAPLTVAP